MRSQSKFPKQKGFFLKTGCSLETRYKVVDEGFTDNLMIDYHDFTISRHKKNGPLVWKIFSIGGVLEAGWHVRSLRSFRFVRFVLFVCLLLPNCQLNCQLALHPLPTSYTPACEIPNAGEVFM